MFSAYRHRLKIDHRDSVMPDLALNRAEHRPRRHPVTSKESIDGIVPEEVRAHSATRFGDRGAHRSHGRRRDRHPERALGSHSAISGKTQSKTIPTTMQTMNGSAPLRMVGSGTSGAMPLTSGSWSLTNNPACVAAL